MNRRDTFRIIPLTLAGIASFANEAVSLEKVIRPPSREGNVPLSLQYPKIVTELLKWIRSTQSEKILEASYAIARAVQKKRTCWCHWNMGHTYRSDIFPERNGQPDILTAGYDPEKSKNGDLLLLSFPFSQFDDLDKKDIYVIGGPSVWGGDCKNAELIQKDIQEMRFRPYSDIWIETNMTSIGPRIKIPGMIAPIGPVTGPVYLTLFWMMMADTCRIHAIDGKTVKIKGDEPKLSGDDINWVGLTDPLMDNFFDEIMRELNLIGSELGELRKIAKMAVDTVLDGGNVYFYSRYPEAFASEASGRRGGLSLARGISDGNIRGTSKDCAIMGIYKPDCEVDLKNLDEFKKRGMRVASVGPISRDFSIPEGRTVHKETLAHIGRFTDTYGHFAIPGFDKKVCPTTGILNCTMLWCICIEIATQIIERTDGNVPVINSNGALELSKEHSPHLRSLRQDRGY
ncbi:hypothetical protein ACFL1R_01170 [Candidatus Latescibacterota bacterium]